MKMFICIFIHVTSSLIITKTVEIQTTRMSILLRMTRCLLVVLYFDYHALSQS